MSAAPSLSSLDASYTSREFKPQQHWLAVRGTYARPIAPPSIFLGRLHAGELTPLPNIVAPSLDQLPGDISRSLKREFWHRHGPMPEWEKKFHAQEWLSSQVEQFKNERLDVAFDDEELRARAERYSMLCGKMQRLEVMQDFARSQGIEPPHVHKAITRTSAAKRLQDVRWWRRQLRKHWTRKAEVHLRAVGMVQKRKQVYASDHMVRCRKGRKARDAALLRELVAVSDAGDQLELYDIAEKSQANPALRRAELMTRLSGFEEVAKLAGHVALFFTLTCPSAFHCTHNEGKRNENWEGHSPRDGQKWLSKMWARSRAKLQRLSILFYGFRIAEPHHDGTPHWHAVLFVPQCNADALAAVIRGIWLSEYAHEAGAQEHRCKIEPIRPEAGTATGYLAKYVAKNIDGFNVGSDYETEGNDAKHSCDRVAAWASAHGIRQFQQIGGPPVSVWRELRRLRNPVAISPAIEAARKAASEESSWSDFVAAIGGIEVGRKGRVSLFGECTGELNRYEELRGEQIAGVQSVARSVVCVPLQSKAKKRCRLVRRFGWGDRSLARVRTREKVWRIQRKASDAGACTHQRLGDTRRESVQVSGPVPSLGPVSITVRAPKSVPTKNRESDTVIAATNRKKVPPWLN
jgi:hypothetical protein